MSGDRKSYTGHGPCPYLKPKPKCAKSRALSIDGGNAAGAKAKAGDANADDSANASAAGTDSADAAGTKAGNADAAPTVTAKP